jgi:hypothetical protein
MKLTIRSSLVPQNPWQRMGRVELRTSFLILHDSAHLVGTTELIKIRKNLFYISKSIYHRWGDHCYSNEVVPLR